jgi:hypothetical protein
MNKMNQLLISYLKITQNAAKALRLMGINPTMSIEKLNAYIKEAETCDVMEFIEQNFTEDNRDEFLLMVKEEELT